MRDQLRVNAVMLENIDKELRKVDAEILRLQAEKTDIVGSSED